VLFAFISCTGIGDEKLTIISVRKIYSDSYNFYAKMQVHKAKPAKDTYNAKVAFKKAGIHVYSSLSTRSGGTPISRR